MKNATVQISVATYSVPAELRVLSLDHTVVLRRLFKEGSRKHSKERLASAVVLSLFIKHYAL